jgi:hypothetical protein
LLGLGITATKTGNTFDIKVLTGLKSFKVKGKKTNYNFLFLILSLTGTQTGDKFTGTVYSSDNKEVMTTSGTLRVSRDGFKLDSKLFDISSKKEVVTLTTDILPNRGQGLSADIGLTSGDKSKSFKIHCKFLVFV